MTPYDDKHSFEVLWEQPRRWGHEVSVGIFRDNELADSLLVTYPKPPDEKELTLDLIRRVGMWISRPPEPVPEKVYLESAIVKLLIGKGYLAEGQKLEDLPDKELSHG